MWNCVNNSIQKRDSVQSPRQFYISLPFFLHFSENFPQFTKFKFSIFTQKRYTMNSWNAVFRSVFLFSLFVLMHIVDAVISVIDMIYDYQYHFNLRFYSFVSSFSVAFRRGKCRQTICLWVIFAVWFCRLFLFATVCERVCASVCVCMDAKAMRTCSKFCDNAKWNIWFCYT